MCLSDNIYLTNGPRPCVFEVLLWRDEGEPSRSDNISATYKPPKSVRHQARKLVQIIVFRTDSLVDSS